MTNTVKKLTRVAETHRVTKETDVLVRVELAEEFRRLKEVQIRSCISDEAYAGELHLPADVGRHRLLGYEREVPRRLIFGTSP